MVVMAVAGLKSLHERNRQKWNGNNNGEEPYQQVFVQLHVALVLRQRRRPVQRREAAVVPLVDGRAQVEQVVQLCWQVCVGVPVGVSGRACVGVSTLRR